MKLIIAGSRCFNDYTLLKDTLDKYLVNTPYDTITVICGMARGADTLGERYALENSLKIEYHEALWNTYGKSAGFIRNEEMVKRATHCIVYWDGLSKGSLSTINLAKTYNLQLRVVMV